MCGIVGCFSMKPLDQNRKTAFEEALGLLESRGPDNRSYKVIDRIMLGHTRLAVIDLHKEANQPMQYKEYTLIFNGEVYNYKELRIELELKGYQFETQSDTEVLLLAYDYWKEDCVKYFNGMWAFAIFDQKEQKLFCSRDRFGKKPFFYYFKDDCFVFASEIKSILPFIEEAKVNYRVIAPFITRGIVDFSEETFFDQIKRLEPSNSLVIDLYSLTMKKRAYYKIEQEKMLQDDEIYALLEDSVKLRLRSDVKVGVSLSGGLDSSSITSIMNEFYDQNLIAIHAKSTNKNSDESDYAIQLANYLGIELDIVEPTALDFWQSLDRVIHAQDEPFSSLSIFMQYFVMQRASQRGCKVMLDGQGADEVFLGYENYFPFIYNELLKEVGFKKEQFFNGLKLFSASAEMIEYEASRLNEFELHWDAIVNRGNIYSKHLDRGIFKKLLGMQGIFENACSEIMSKRLQALLRYEDRNSMAFGVETRLPFLDYRLVESILSLPLKEKFRDGYLKHLLRRIMYKSDLMPHSLVWRYNKMGYEAPQASWIDAYKDEMLKEIHESQLLSNFFSKIDVRRDEFLWRLFCLARWEKVFNVQC